MQLPYDDVAQILQFRHLTHGATHGLDIVEQHEQQDDDADDAHHAKHLLNSHHEDALIRVMNHDHCLLFRDCRLILFV